MYDISVLIKDHMYDISVLIKDHMYDISVLREMCYNAVNNVIRGIYRNLP